MLSIRQSESIQIPNYSLTSNLNLFSFSATTIVGEPSAPMESHWLGFARRSPSWVSHWLPHLPFVQEIWHFSTAIFSPKSHYSCPIYFWWLMVELANEMMYETLFPCFKAPPHLSYKPGIRMCFIWLEFRPWIPSLPFLSSMKVCLNTFSLINNSSNNFFVWQALNGPLNLSSRPHWARALDKVCTWDSKRYDICSTTTTILIVFKVAGISVRTFRILVCHCIDTQ